MCVMSGHVPSRGGSGRPRRASVLECGDERSEVAALVLAALETTKLFADSSTLTCISHDQVEMPTGWSAGLQPALGVRKRKAGFKPALRPKGREKCGLPDNGDCADSVAALQNRAARRSAHGGARPPRASLDAPSRPAP